MTSDQNFNGNESSDSSDELKVTETDALFDLLEKKEVGSLKEAYTLLDHPDTDMFNRWIYQNDYGLCFNWKDE